MNRQEAIRFLKAHQPLPSDEDMPEAVIREFDEIRKFFLQNPDEESIPLLLNSFGDGSGYGVYQLVEDVLLKHKKDVVLPHLLVALTSKHRGVRDWCAEIAVNFPHPDLIAPLATLLEQLDDIDSRFSAVSALEEIEDPRATTVLREALGREPEEEIRELIEGILSQKR